MLSLALYRLKRVYHFFKTGLLKGLPAQMKYRHPERSLTILSVSGTDGKTTSATLLHHMLSEGGMKTGLITTVAAQIGTKKIDTGFHVTAPEPDLLYEVLSQMQKARCSHVVLEMTSHGAYQFRNWGIKPTYGGITNITHEHYDYHQNYAEYAAAKLRQFTHCQKVFFPEGDSSYGLARKILRKVPIKLYSNDTRLPANIKTAIVKTFSEPYNQHNATLAALMALEVGISPKAISKAIRSFSGIPGRMEVVPNTRGIQIVIDFAHTPEAVRSVLEHLRTKTAKNLLVILGAAGKRDITKRPKMGQVAAQLSDLVIFTAEDPRSENVWSIINQLKSQLDHTQNRVVSISDRGQAIYFTINNLAQPGDVIAILGKGHEQTMCFGTSEYHWSDREAVETVLNKKVVPTLGAPV